MKIFLDSNIHLRLLVPENQTSSTECQTLFNLIGSGTIIPYVSETVILEVVYTLSRTYKFPKSQILSWLTDMQKLRNIVIVNKSDTSKAISLFHKHNIKFGDCLISTQIPKGVILCTYDPDFQKIPGLLTQTPSEICKHMSH